MYSFSLSDESAHPAYYKKYAGSVTDTACFRDFIAEAGFEGDVTIVADKGFMSSTNADGITDSGLDYIIPLKRGNAAVKGKIPSSPSGYQGTFIRKKGRIRGGAREKEGFQMRNSQDLFRRMCMMCLPPILTWGR